MKTTIFKGIFLLAMLVLVGGVANEARADLGVCSFYRDLSIGSRGEDVRCLQQYLLGAGYGNTFSSYGTPDGVFGPLTQSAVMQWQVSMGLPASGYFDANSRARMSGGYGGYTGYTGGGLVLGASTCVPSYDPNTGYLITNCGNQNTYYGNTYGNNNDVRAWSKIQEALEAIDDAQNDIDDSNKNTSTAENELDDAKDDIVDSVHAYFVDRDFREAFDKAEDALQNAEDASDDAGGSSNHNNSSRADAENAIEDAHNAIDDAQNEIDDADDNGDDVNDARDILNDAQDKLDDAENEFDDHNYSDAEDLANDAEDLANEAVDAID